MSKNKKIALIICGVIVALVLVGVLIYFIGFRNPKGKGEEVDNSQKISKVDKLCEQLQGKQEYSFEAKLDDRNKMYYAKKDGVAYTETIYQGDKSKFVIKDGDSYLLMDDEKTYYKYQNNDMDLNKITDNLQELSDTNYTEGKERIDKKQYKYEEYDGITQFSFTTIDNTTENKEVKTRFYFNNNELVYIKTIIGTKEELLKVTISDKTDDAVFDVPSDYKSAQ